MNVETFNYSPESLAPFFYINKRDRKNIYIFPTEKETLGGPAIDAWRAALAQ